MVITIEMELHDLRQIDCFGILPRFWWGSACLLHWLILCYMKTPSIGKIYGASNKAQQRSWWVPTSRGKHALARLCTHLQQGVFYKLIIMICLPVVLTCCCKINLWVLSVKQNHEIAVLFVGLRIFWGIPSIEKFGEWISLNLMNAVQWEPLSCVRRHHCR